MTNAKATILDLDALMETSMDAVVTLPDYVTPSKGLYVLSLNNAEIKEGKDKEGNRTARLVITYKIEETVDSEEPPFPNGSLFTESFTATEDGLAYFKKQAMKILNVSDMTGATLRDIFDGLKSVDAFQAAITVKKTKNEQGTEYTNINVRPLHDAPAN